MRKTSKRYLVEVRERAVRLVLEHVGEYETEWAAIVSIAEKFGCSSETLRAWVRRARVDCGRRPGTTTAEAQRIKELERECRELRRANEDTTHCPLRRFPGAGAGAAVAASASGVLAGGVGLLASPWRLAASAGAA